MSKLPDFLQDATPFILDLNGEVYDATVVSRHCMGNMSTMMLVEITLEDAIKVAERTPYPDMVNTQMFLEHDTYSLNWKAYEISGGN